MAKRAHVYTIARPIEELRALLASPQAVGRALAFVEATEESRGQLQWRLRPAMAAITGAQSLLVSFNATPDHVHWVGRSPRLLGRGDLRLTPAGPQATALAFTLEMAGVGAASLVIEPLAGVQLQAQMDSFVDHLEAALERAAEKEVIGHDNR
ncbi:MAG TPA: hypothetical protein PLJ35_03130 [Anaerolineae bacterium]|nr:hypothetical protein [Anaerolineae bacterium]HOQ97795.1 hypothetical protein [Anaerolineae bacterium]HPL27108.1 hypothetical protein [Anaerolineae bacterium]